MSNYKIITQTSKSKYSSAKQKQSVFPLIILEKEIQANPCKHSLGQLSQTASFCSTKTRYKLEIIFTYFTSK